MDLESLMQQFAHSKSKMLLKHPKYNEDGSIRPFTKKGESVYSEMVGFLYDLRDLLNYNKYTIIEDLVDDLDALTEEEY